MVVDRFTFNEWLLEHRENFITYSMEEIAEIALASGYSRAEVDAWMDRKCTRLIQR